MGERLTGPKALGAGLLCLAIAGVVLVLIQLGRLGWSLDAIEVVVVLVPVGAYLTLRGLGWDLARELRRLLGKGREPGDA